MMIWEFIAKHEFLATWLNLVVDVIFGLLVLWEFKYLRHEAKEKKQQHIQKLIYELCARVVWCLIEICDKKFKTSSIKSIYDILHDDRGINVKIIDGICKKTKLNEQFVKYVIKSIDKEHNKMYRINYVSIKEVLIEDKNRMRNGTFYASDIIVERLRKCFKNDKEIERLYKYQILIKQL